MSHRIIPRQELVDLALPMTIDDSGERVGQVGLRIDGIGLVHLDERGDGCPVLRSRVMPGEESVLGESGLGGYAQQRWLDFALVSQTLPLVR